MTGCLTEEALINLLMGESATEEQTHVKSCAACGHRYRNLTQQMKLIETALTAMPPPVSVGLRMMPWIRAVAPAFATALAVFVAGFWFGERFLPSHTELASVSAPASSAAANTSWTMAARENVPRADEAEPLSASYVTFLRDSFEQDDPCSSQDHSFNPACSGTWLTENR